MASVLVIDDDASFRRAICRHLTSLGYDVREAVDGKQGVKEYQAAPADVVLLDMYMPVLDGLETLEQLLRYDPKARVIAMTGGGIYKNVGVLEPAVLLGARAMLFKPISTDELRAAIDRALSLAT